MKTCLAILLAVACHAMPSLAVAQEGTASPIRANVALVSNYVYRGLTNSSGDPAIQGGFDFEHSSGFYAGIWGSSTGPDSSYEIEIDGYFGWRFTPAPDFSLEVGYQRYAFPGHSPAGGHDPGTTSPDTDEIHVAGGWKWFTLTYAYILGDAFGKRDAQGSDYLQLAAAIPLGASGVTLSAHVGRQHFRGTNAPLWPASTGCSNDCLSYTDYAVGMHKLCWGLDFGVAYTTTNARARLGDGTPVYLDGFNDNIGGDQWIVSVQKSF